MPTTLRNPSLYADEGTSAVPDAPALRGIQCRCGHRAFPPQHRGCEVCGDHGDALADTLLSGGGRLLASAIVHRHAAAYPPVPFTVVEVELDDGPVVRGLLHGTALADLAPGTVMRTAFEAVQIDGETLRDLRFLPAKA